MKLALIALTSLFLLPAFATEPVKASHADVTLIHVTDLDKMMSDKKTPTYIFDANNEKTRKNNGLIPGALALDSSHAYNTAMLPQDKNANVVFYCANTMCMASHEAAHLAMKNGYTHTMVMADGIEGWRKAGKRTEAFAKN